MPPFYWRVYAIHLQVLFGRSSSSLLLAAFVHDIIRGSNLLRGHHLQVTTTLFRFLFCFFLIMDIWVSISHFSILLIKVKRFPYSNFCLNISLISFVLHVNWRYEAPSYYSAAPSYTYTTEATKWVENLSNNCPFFKPFPWFI